ncbi:urokinase plasminogen activator surface receptor-like [Danio aesculapii]|uniref:urokinase plasminogen activator surface receptor-like n=1 Tax=Danio aesculapii TaxID=1142201 RepID=UPI0024BFD6D2|nr:urokinase plasminogen activator surface receptor-like [Danio aesculapii]
MDLQISLFILLAFVTTGHSLSCYQCGGSSCAGQTLTTCPAAASHCESVTMVTDVGGFTSKTLAKDCAAGCATGSMNLGVLMMSSECCNSDRCNVNDAPDPSTGVPNGKTCYTCDEKSCSNVLKCSGTEDRCITAKVTSEGQTTVVKGCASKSICDATSVSRVQRISCCSGNLCNGAKSVTQSFLILCFPLIAFILMP